jgi:sodium/hydrogen antiporter
VVVRPLAVLVSLVGSRLDHPGEKAFVAWFGVRGVGTLYYLATLVTSGALAAGERDALVWTCIAAVVLSIVVHGLTAGPALRRMLARGRGGERIRRRPAPRPATPRAR